MTFRCLALDSTLILRSTCRCSGKCLGLFFNRDGIACKSSPGNGICFVRFFDGTSSLTGPINIVLMIRSKRETVATVSLFDLVSEILFWCREYTEFFFCHTKYRKVFSFLFLINFGFFLICMLLYPKVNFRLSGENRVIYGY